MRRLIIVAFAGCYTASPPQGVPCDPAARHCPVGQRCVPGSGGFVCSTGDGEPPDAAPRPDGGGTSPDAALQPIQKIYTATIAECSSPANPSPQLCRELNGNTELVIDVRDSTTNAPWNAYLRFQLDGALEGRTVTKAVLQLVVTNAANAPGPDGGTVFEVQPFTLAALSTGTPAKVGSMLASHAAAIDNGDVISFVLANPAAIARASSPVYLGLFPNDDDGVNYFNREGAMPPRLLVEAQ